MAFVEAAKNHLPRRLVNRSDRKMSRAIDYRRAHPLPPSSIVEISTPDYAPPLPAGSVPRMDSPGQQARASKRFGQLIDFSTEIFCSARDLGSGL